MDKIYRETVPVYWLQKDLTEALINTELPKHWVDIKPFVPRGLFLLPKGLIKNPDNFQVDWIYIEFIPPNLGNRNIQLGKNLLEVRYPQKKCLIWVNDLSRVASYSGTIRLDPDEQGNPQYGNNNFFPSIEHFLDKPQNFKEKEAAFMRLLSNLSLQIMLFMMAKPEAISAQSGFGTNIHRHSHKLRTPVWIGKNFQIKKQYPKSPAPESTNKSSQLRTKITHWRRGHWRNQPIGKRNHPEYKQVWIEPVLING